MTSRQIYNCDQKIEKLRVNFYSLASRGASLSDPRHACNMRGASVSSQPYEEQKKKWEKRYHVQTCGEDTRALRENLNMRKLIVKIKMSQDMAETAPLTSELFYRRKIPQEEGVAARLTVYR